MALPSLVPPPVMRMRLERRRSERNIGRAPILRNRESRFLTGLRPVRKDKLYGVRRKVARQAKAVICIVEFGRDAGTGGAAGDFDVMAP